MSIDSTPATQQSYVSLDDVCVSFGSERVLAAVSLSIGCGEVVSVIGRSGAGKSTLLRVIGGLIEPTSGSSTVSGSPSASMRKAKQFGFMPQSPALFPWLNVEDNVALLMGANTDSTRVGETLELVGLAHRAHDLPSTLSGGMQHRVALARAVAVGAPILLLDEPFSSVDEYTRDELYRELMAIVERGMHTVVLVTHSILEAVLLSDRVVVLGGGPARILAEVVIHEERPRIDALDRGRLAEPVAQLRALLRSEPS